MALPQLKRRWVVLNFELDQHRPHVLAAFACVLVLLKIKVGESQKVPRFRHLIVLRHDRVKHLYCVLKLLQLHKEATGNHAEIDAWHLRLLLCQHELHAALQSLNGLGISGPQNAKIPQGLQSIDVVLVYLKCLAQTLLAFLFCLGLIAKGKS